MRTIPWQASNQFGVFTLAQAEPSGWTRSSLALAVRQSRLVRVRTGCYALPSDVSAIGLATLPWSVEPQVEIRTLDGQFIARVDFYWEELGLVGEADGRAKYTDDELWRQNLREGALTERGVVTTRWGWREARQSALMLDRVRRAAHRAMLLRSVGILPEVRTHSVRIRSA